MPIDLNEITAITTDLGELNGQISLLQIELSKPLKRLKMIMSMTDTFGDEITDEDKEKMMIKIRTEYEKCKLVCKGKIRDLPKLKREKPGP